MNGNDGFAGVCFEKWKNREIEEIFAPYYLFPAIFLFLDFSIFLIFAERRKFAGLGLEPRLAESESAVLPLDDPAVGIKVLAQLWSDVQVLLLVHLE